MSELAVQFVRLGYGDCVEPELAFRSLNFRTEELTTDVAQLCIQQVGEYNAFDGEKVAEAIAQFKGRVSSWQFGREGSPVLYVNLPYWTNQAENSGIESGKGRRITDDEHRELYDALHTVFVEELEADEFMAADGSNDHKLRIWWD